LTENPPFAITRTIYDPASKDFVFDLGDGKNLPNVKEWINNHNPVIYWYILRIDNPTEADIFQWAVELYTSQALTILEAYIDGIDRRFEVKKRERDAWSDKYVLSIPKQLQIPIIGRGTRRLYFKIDINCKEGLMHQYGISGAFKAQGMGDVEIKEKIFQYSCKVGEFRQIFDKNPDDASDYAKKRLEGKFSSNAVLIFTNSFRMIHELSRYCHSRSVEQDTLLSKLRILKANFEKVPEIAGERILPLIHYEMEKLSVIDNKASLTPDIIHLCDSLVELLHLEVAGAEGDNTSTSRPKEDPERLERDRQRAKQEEGRLRKKVEEQEKRREEEQKEKERKEKEDTEKREREKQSAKLEEERRKREEIPKTYTNSIGMEFTLIPAGEFMMGSNEYEREKPIHKVNIRKSFYLGTYPVTQKEWKAVMGTSPSDFKGDNLPVEQVSWNDVQDFIKKLNEKEGGNKYRLPTEAEWEYSARAGKTTSYSFGDEESKLGDYAWYYANSGSKTHEVGQKKPNPWGLYDMHGNVWEWVQDIYHDSYSGASTDGSAWEGSGSYRVIRGGSWNDDGRYCRSAGRSNSVPVNRFNYLGSRLLRIL